MATNKKGLGRGLSALIPDDEMDALSDVTRETPLLPVAVTVPRKREGFSGAAERGGSAEKTKKAGGEKSDTPDDTLQEPPRKAKAMPVEKDKAPMKPSDENKGTFPGSFFVPVDSIVANPFQPRRTFDEEELAELAYSIGLHGILQPVLVRPDPSGETEKYQLVAGERRWRAAQQAGLKQIPVIVRPMADQQALELALIENVQRHDISAIDAAIAYRRLASEFTLSQEQIARRVGKSRSAVANTIRLLDLPEEARKAIENGDISEGHGRAILLATGEGTRRALLRRVLRDKLSVREVENLARQVTEESLSGQKTGEAVKASISSDEKSHAWQQAEQDCTRKLGVRVKVKAARRRNVILIECGTPSELQRVLALMRAKL